MSPHLFLATLFSITYRFVILKISAKFNFVMCSWRIHPEQLFQSELQMSFIPSFDRMHTGVGSGLPAFAGANRAVECKKKMTHGIILR
jgi:hypothetical protein